MLVSVSTPREMTAPIPWHSPEAEKAILSEDDLMKALTELESATTTVPDNGDDLAKAITGEDGVQPAIDVSDYLDGLTKGITDAITEQSSALHKGFTEVAERDAVFAKAFAGMASLVKSQQERIEALEGQPVGRRAVTTRSEAVLNKAFVDGGNGQDTLSKAEVLDTMETMFQKSMNEQRGGQSLGGFPLDIAISNFEQTGQLDPRLANEIKAFRQASA